MLLPVETRGEPALPTLALVAGAVVVVGCCVGCALVAAHFSGFPLLVFGGCACVLGLAAMTALVGRAGAEAGGPRAAGGPRERRTDGDPWR
jgi:hypothetical protein